MKSIILGVSGSIAAYKAADITSALTKHNIDVHVVMTTGATKFITPLTFQSLSKNRVNANMFDEKDPKEIKHIDMSKKADAFVVAPATANIIAKLANGIADDMLSCLGLSTYNIPKIIAPAMNTMMYQNPIVQNNLDKLTAYGYKIIEPKTSLLACGDVGKGALADVNVIVNFIIEELNNENMR